MSFFEGIEAIIVIFLASGLFWGWLLSPLFILGLIEYAYGSGLVFFFPAACVLWVCGTVLMGIAVAWENVLS